MAEFETRRLNMVESQLRPNKVSDPRLLRAMGELPRERFVPARLRGIAYVDEDVPLGDGRYLMEPMVLARLVQAARIRAADVALEIGTGSAYATAVLARLASTVVSLESDPRLADSAGAILSELGIDNAIVVGGPLAEGHPPQAPYDVILFNGAVAEIPPAISAQLAEGGRLVAVVARGDGMGLAQLMTRTGGMLATRPLFDASTPCLPGMAPSPGFVFQ